MNQLTATPPQKNQEKIFIKIILIVIFGDVAYIDLPGVFWGLFSCSPFALLSTYSLILLIS